MMVFWFKDIEYPKMLIVMGLVFSLVVARIPAIKFFPDVNEE